MKVVEDVVFKGSLIEVGQSMPVQFSLVEKKDDVIYRYTPMFKCRDYLSDVVFTKETGEEIAVYGWKSKKKLAEKVFNDRLELGVKIPKVPDLTLGLSTFKDNLELLHEYEQSQGLSLTVVEETGDETTPVYLSADPFWYKTTAGISYYTYLLRLICYKKIKNFSYEEIEKTTKGKAPSDFGIVNLVKNKYNKVYKNCADLLTNEPSPLNSLVIKKLEKEDYYDLGEMVHNYSGIRSYINTL